LRVILSGEGARDPAGVYTWQLYGFRLRFASLKMTRADDVQLWFFQFISCIL